MGLQLLFCVEAKKGSKSDWVYIKETWSHYYQIPNDISLKPIFFDGKGNFNRGKINKQIGTMKRQYKKNGETIVLYCIDTDNILADPDRVKEFNTIKQHCIEKNYEFVWFCRDVEEVYWGERVPDSEKVRMSGVFRKHSKIKEVPERNLTETLKNKKNSNILIVLDKYLQRKL